MNIQTATKQYEAWLGQHIPLIETDLETKHAAMAQDVFPFLRATFYRWVQRWPEVCPETAQAPQVLAVGDLHVENFGTWRDAEGRLAWGINDFDEAHPMPYTIDLVRLATSAVLAIKDDHLAIDPDLACDMILEGYVRRIKGDGQAFVFAERHRRLREMVHARLSTAEDFWHKLDALPALTDDLPEHVKTMFSHALPEPGLPYKAIHRTAGLGSLGRQRFTAIADWRGGRIARETKPLVPSAYNWEGKTKSPAKVYYAAIVAQAVRVPDPFLTVDESWVVRRIAPDCSRIELTDLPKERSEEKLLRAMGTETANIHLGSRSAIDAVRADLKQRPAKWLHQAAVAMARDTQADFEAWRKLSKSSK